MASQEGSEAASEGTCGMKHALCRQSCLFSRFHLRGPSSDRRVVRQLGASWDAPLDRLWRHHRQITASATDSNALPLTGHASLVLTAAN